MSHIAGLGEFVRFVGPSGRSLAQRGFLLGRRLERPDQRRHRLLFRRHNHCKRTVYSKAERTHDHHSKCSLRTRSHLLKGPDGAVDKLAIRKLSTIQRNAEKRHP